MNVTVPEALLLNAVWKWSPRLAVNVLPVTLTVTDAVCVMSTRRPSFPIAELLPNVLPVTVSVSAPLLLRITTLSSAEPVTVALVNADVPVRSVKSSPASPTVLPLFATEESISENPFTVVPRTPSSWLAEMIIRLRLTLPVVFSSTAGPDVS